MADAHERQFYTVAEAAQLLHVSPSTVWRWIAAEKLPAYRLGGRTIRIKPEDLRTIARPVRNQVAPPLSIELTALLEPPSEEEIARRRAAVAETLKQREHRNIAPLTSADLMHMAREERTPDGPVYGHAGG